MSEKSIVRGATAPLKGLISGIGVLPFILFALAFMVFPAGSLLIGGFQDKVGNFTLNNILHLTRPDIINSYLLTIQISLVTALGGGLIGFLLAYGVTLGGLPRFMEGFMSTFCGVASNFAGVPLAFAFISTLGRVGMITIMLQTWFGINIYDQGFNLYSFWGLSLTYMYFQIPLMVLIITPALEGMKKQWREAAENLGASSFQYWITIALPVLTPTLLASFILLFGNSFGAYATAYALTGGLLNITPILIGAQIRGDVLHDPNLGYA
ncbi:MAG TPA: acriflavin resistance protein, partial [Firmicutes bacterium]|nr:acriflavin resistance protein [Bacillota bacterium]